MTERRLSAAQLRVRLGREKGQCTWCGRPVPRGCRTWCGAACVEQFRLRYDSGFLRSRVFARDGGVCALCGLDAEYYRGRLRRWRVVAQSPLERLAEWGSPWKRRTNRRGRKNWRRWRWERSQAWRAYLEAHARWEADHIVPVCEGGAELGLGNLRTLCRACHQRQTARLAVRRARQRREAAGR